MNPTYDFTGQVALVTRHAVAAGLTADVSAAIIAVWVVRLIYG
jgi:spore maturation protein SpmB